MLTYWLKCKSNTENGRWTLSPKCALCGNKKSRRMKEQVGKGLLSILGLKTPFNKIPLFGEILL